MSLSQQQKKVQRSKDNKAAQAEAMKNKKLEYYIPPPEVIPPKPKEVKKASTKGNRFAKKDADKEVVDDMFSAYKIKKPETNNKDTEIKLPIEDVNNANNISNKESL
jgi:hypothetical protein